MRKGPRSAYSEKHQPTCLVPAQTEPLFQMKAVPKPSPQPVALLRASPSSRMDGSRSWLLHKQQKGRVSSSSSSSTRAIVATTARALPAAGKALPGARHPRAPPLHAQLLPITVTHVQRKPSPPPMGVFAALKPPGPALRQAAPLPVSVPRLPAFPRSGPRPLSRPLKAVAVPLRAASAETLFGAGVWAGRAQRPPWRRLLLLRLKSSPFSARPSRPPRPISCQFRSARPGPTTPGAAPFRPAAADADALAGSFGRKETPRRRVGAAADNAPSSSPLPPSLPCLDAAEDEHYGLQREEAGG